jgi:hypothetical protein
MHETRDIHPFGVAMAGAGLGAFLILVALMPRVIMPAIGSRHERIEPRVERFTLPPEPRLQPDSMRDLEQIRGAEMKHLESYGWIDRAHGVVHIPIERAMQIVAQRGLPVRPTTGTPPVPLPQPAPDIETNPPWGRR